MFDIIKKDIDIGNKHSALICPIGDIHIDAPNWDKEFFEYVMDWIYKEKDVYVIGMGDYLDLATKDSPTDVFSQKNPGTAQIKKLMKYFKPLADENRLIGLLQGNHEFRLNRYAGVDIVDLVCEFLDVPYLNIGEFIQFNIKRNGSGQKYIFYASHGSSGAYTKGGKINAMYRAKQPFEADVYLFGHTHDLSVNPEEYFTVEDGKRVVKEYYIVNTGHFTFYWKSYAQQKGYSIGRRGSPKIYLYGAKHQVRVNL